MAVGYLHPPEEDLDEFALGGSILGRLKVRRFLRLGDEIAPLLE